MRKYTPEHVAKARAVLIEAATLVLIVSRDELVKGIGLGVWNPDRRSDVRMMASLLSEVADAEYAKNRPFLTCVVSRIAGLSNLYDFGLLGYAEVLGLPAEPFDFIEQERVRAYEFWRLPDKAPKEIA